MKLAIIGAGSKVFTRKLLLDVFQAPALKGCEIALMNRSFGRLESLKKYLDEVTELAKIKFPISYTTDRISALEGADYVISVFQTAGGVDAYRLDYETPLAYGVDQSIGQCVGPGGIFRGLRNAPVLTGLIRDMERCCPDALLLNYVNPMAINLIVLSKTSNVRIVGLCHGVQTTLRLIAMYTGVSAKEIDFTCAGINHMTWYLKLEHKGKDLYPVLKERFEQPEYYTNERVRGEVLRHFGYFMTESSGHLSEYLPWFRKNKETLAKYCACKGFSGESGAAFRNQVATAELLKKGDPLALMPKEIPPRSYEYGSYIIEAMESGVPFDFSGNVINQGVIDNLPEGCCVEVPVTADGTGLHPHKIGKLPFSLAAMNNSNINVQMLAAEAALNGDPQLVFEALALDPLTASVLDLQQIRKLAHQMLTEQSVYLPQFEGKKIYSVGEIRIPEGTVPAPAPLDPAVEVVMQIRELLAGS